MCACVEGGGRRGGRGQGEGWGKKAEAGRQAGEGGEEERRGEERGGEEGGESRGLPLPTPNNVPNGTSERQVTARPEQRCRSPNSQTTRAGAASSQLIHKSHLSDPPRARGTGLRLWAHVGLPKDQSRRMPPLSNPLVGTF